MGISLQTFLEVTFSLDSHLIRASLTPSRCHGEDGINLAPNRNSGFIEVAALVCLLPCVI